MMVISHAVGVYIVVTPASAAIFLVRENTARKRLRVPSMRMHSTKSVPEPVPQTHQNCTVPQHCHGKLLRKPHLERIQQAGPSASLLTLMSVVTDPAVMARRSWSIRPLR